MNSRKRYFVRIDGKGRIIAGSGQYRKKQPAIGRWLEIYPDVCCTTTTSTSTSTTTTTEPG